MSFGVAEVLFIWGLLIFLAPALILLAIANNKGRSKHFVWWAILGWLGLLIGAVILLTGPSQGHRPE
jgi:hypothetical protein